VFFDWNGIKAIQAKKGDNSAKLALLAGISRDEFLEYNDLRVFDPIVPGEVYYADSKKNRAKVPFHTVQHGQSLWEVSQKYGIKMKALMAKNRMERPEKLKAGRVMWLRHFRPEDEPIRYESVPVPTIKATPVQEIAHASQQLQIDSIQIKTVEENAKAVIGTDSLTPEKPESASEMAATEKVNLELLATTKDSAFGIVNTGNIPQYQPVVLASTGKDVALVAETITATVKTVPVMPAPIEGEIIVSEGMTWYRISRHYRQSLDSLQAWNAGDQSLQAGRKIRVQPKSRSVEKNPEPLPFRKTEQVGSDAKGTHVVQAGESCFAIARKYGMKVERLLELNGKNQPEIKVGEALKVEKKP
jgi:membrane-bound lytic murein transglycosylase D